MQKYKIIVNILGYDDGFVKFEVKRPFEFSTVRELTQQALSDYIDGLKDYCQHKGYEFELREIDRLQHEKRCLDHNHDLYVNAMLMKDWKRAEIYLENMRRSLREIDKLEHQSSYLNLHNQTFSILKEGR